MDYFEEFYRGVRVKRRESNGKYLLMLPNPQTAIDSGKGEYSLFQVDDIPMGMVEAPAIDGKEFPGMYVYPDPA